MVAVVTTEALAMAVAAVVAGWVLLITDAALPVVLIEMVGLMLAVVASIEMDVPMLAAVALIEMDALI
jgi:hypothetical protein